MASRSRAGTASHPRSAVRPGRRGGETFVDFERGLNFCVLQARTALGDDAKNPAYIETLPRRGYRFVGQIVEEKSGGLRARRSTWLAAAALALLVIVSVAAWPRPETFSPKTMIAVLPFDGEAPFAEGMTEELITHLGALQPHGGELRAGGRSRARAAVAKEARHLSFPLAGVDPKLDALNGDPRFEEMLRSAGLTRRSRSGTSSPYRASRRS